MRFVDFPQPLSLDLYEQAATTYVELVSERAHAVYQTGNINCPGISDLDLIVVPMGPRYDNFAFFSTARLPQPLRSVFRHGPFVLPLEMSDIVRYTTHTAPKLIGGRDVLSAPSAQGSLANEWSMLLEDHSRYLKITSGAVRADRISVSVPPVQAGQHPVPHRNVAQDHGFIRRPGPSMGDELATG